MDSTNFVLVTFSDSLSFFGQNSFSHISFGRFHVLTLSLGAHWIVSSSHWLRVCLFGPDHRVSICLGCTMSLPSVCMLVCVCVCVKIVWLTFKIFSKICFLLFSRTCIAHSAHECVFFSLLACLLRFRCVVFAKSLHATSFFIPLFCPPFFAFGRRWECEWFLYMPFLNAVFPLRWPLFACYSFRCWAFSGSLHITTHTAIGQFELDYYIELLKMWSICLCCSAGLAIASAMVCKQAVAGRAKKSRENTHTVWNVREIDDNGHKDLTRSPSTRTKLHKTHRSIQCIRS